MALAPNSTKLKAVIDFFGIPISSVAKTCGVSRAYVSRLLSPNDQLEGSPAFWIAVENNLPTLIQHRQRHVFHIECAATEKADELRKAG